MRNPHPLTRMTLLVPAPKTDDEVRLVDDLIGELVDVCGGVTFSTKSPPSIFGSWLDDQGVQQDDDLMLIIADAPFSLAAESTVDAWLDWIEDLKLWCQESFNQDVIWITLTSTARVTAFDYQKTRP
ncbi:MAG: hypothetical protein AAB539_03835 [Patescibacteria group bacterium]